MTSYLALSHYSAWLVLLIGLLTLGGLLGMGNFILGWLRWRLPTPWREPTSLVLGIQVLSLAVQVTAFIKQASPQVLIVIWGLIVMTGLATLARSFQFPVWLRHRSALVKCHSLLAGVIFSCLLNLMVALAPSTKIDEIYYHMLMPSRVVSDQALVWYRQPWEAAATSHMNYQLALTPLHALGIPDAGNVVSWGLSVMLLWWFWHLAISFGHSPAWIWLGMAAMIFGLHSTVWFTTGGSHALGILSFSIALAALACFSKLCEQANVASVAAMCSLLLVTAVNSKLSMLLIGFLLWLGCLFWSWQKTVRGSLAKLLWCSCLPWLLFFLPLTLWTYHHSGAPFGPFLGHYFSGSVYHSSTAASYLLATKMGDLPFTHMLRETILQYHPFLWLGVLILVRRGSLPCGLRALLGVCFFIQLLCLVFVLPFDLRFLGGLPYGLLILLSLFAAQKWRDFLTVNAFRYAMLWILLAPWLVLQLYFAKPFVAVVSGMQPAEKFQERYLALYADFYKLDRLLPKEAVLLNEYLRIGNVYAPRPIYLDAADLPAGKEVYLIVPGQPETWLAQRTHGNYQLERVIYTNPEAVLQTFRQPGMPSVRGTFSVIRLCPR